MMEIETPIWSVCSYLLLQHSPQRTNVLAYWVVQLLVALSLQACMGVYITPRFRSC